MQKTKSQIALFWDYENVPIQRSDWRKFIKALQNFLIHQPVVFAKCFLRERQISQDGREILQLVQRLKLKFVKKNEPNAVDQSLIESCKSVCMHNKTITRVILISGDGDFLQMGKELLSKKIDFRVLCIRNHGNLRLMRHSKFYPYEMVVDRQDSWWRFPHSIIKKKKVKNSRQDIDLEEDDDDEDINIYDDGDWEFQKYDLDERDYNDDEVDDEPEMIYNLEDDDEDFDYDTEDEDDDDLEIDEEDEFDLDEDDDI